MLEVSGVKGDHWDSIIKTIASTIGNNLRTYVTNLNLNSMKVNLHQIAADISPRTAER